MKMFFSCGDPPVVPNSLYKEAWGEPISPDIAPPLTWLCVKTKWKKGPSFN